MNILYIAPDIPVPHTGEFVGGSTHVLKIAENLAKRDNKVFILSRRVQSRQKKYEKITDNIFTRRIYRGLFFPLGGKLSSKNEEEGKFLRNLIEKPYFFVYRFILIFFVLYLLKSIK